MEHKCKRYSRRQFLISTSAATLGVRVIANASAFAKPITEPAKTISESEQGSPKGTVLHIVGYSHIDAAWLWPWRDGSNVVLNTFRSALDRMKETPGFKYCHSSAIHYQWVKQSYPKMFEEIKERVKEGR